MADPARGIYEFKEGEEVWRVLGLGGVTGNPGVHSEPLIEVLLAAFPNGAPRQFSDLACVETKVHVARIGVGQLPLVAIGSFWQNKQPVSLPSLAPEGRTVQFDTSKTRFISLDEVIRRGIIPRRSYALGKAYPYLANTRLASIEIGGDPWAILIPVIELIRFYYGTSSRLTQAFFWGEFCRSFNHDKSGLLPDGKYRIHLARRHRDSDAWILARFHASAVMQREALRCYNSIQAYRANTHSANPGHFPGFECGFPFAGQTELRVEGIPLPSGTSRFLVLRILRCTARFPYGPLICDRDDRHSPRIVADDADLPVLWVRACDKEDAESEVAAGDDANLLYSDQEPAKWKCPLIVELNEDRFADLAGRVLIKEKGEVRKYRSMKATGRKGDLLRGFGTGAGIWGKTDRKPAQVESGGPAGTTPQIPANLSTFFSAMGAMANHSGATVRYLARVAEPPVFEASPATVGFPLIEPTRRTRNAWALVLDSAGRQRARRVAIAEVATNEGVCYVLEAERSKSEGDGARNRERIAVLVLARRDYRDFSGKEFGSILNGTSIKGRWPPEGELPDYRKSRAIHPRMATEGVLAHRIWRAVTAVLELGDVEHLDEPV